MLNLTTAWLLLLVNNPQAGEASSTVVWKWQPEPGICGLRQLTGEADGLLGISRIPGRGATTIMLQDRQAKAGQWAPLGPVILSLDPGGSYTADSILGPGEAPGTRAVTATVSDQHDVIDKMARATAVTISHAKLGSLQVSVRSPAAAIKAIRECEDKMLRKWGFDPVALHGLRSPPSPLNSLVDWFTPNNYPRIAAIYGVGGFVVAVLQVGADGKAQSCKVVNQPLTDFRDAVCEALKQRARFRPAIDARGQPISTPYVVRVQFQPTR